MSRVNKNKHVMRELNSDDFSLPKENQSIVKIVGSKGNNLHEVESSEIDIPNYLASMPTKFRKNVWVKRGDFVLVEPIDEGDKVKAEIVRVLTPEHQKIYEKDGVWPKKFSRKRDHQNEDDMDDDLLVKNLNRRDVEEPESEESSDEE